MSGNEKDASVYRELLERVRAMPAVDAHEHLAAEREYLKEPVDALSVYSQYTRLPMFASGLSEDDWERMHDPEIPVRERWRLAEPHVERIRHTSFARAAEITMDHFWGARELRDDNVESLSERIVAEHKPGIYREVLAKHCGINSVLNQDTSTDYTNELDAYRDKDMLEPVFSLMAVDPPENLQLIRLGDETGFVLLDEYLEWAQARLEALAAGGAVAFKATALPYQASSREAAVRAFEERIRNEGACLRSDEPGPAVSYMHEELLKSAGKLGIPVAVHTGFWGDFRLLNPTHMIPLIQQHPDIHFDLFHTGVPYVRETGIMAVNFANVSVNMCWAHSINEAMARSALDEYIDQLGTDKIIAFGGDVRWFVHKTYGHLELARRNVAQVLAGRIAQGLMDVEEAARIARAWFYDNPMRVYGLASQEAAK